MIIRQQIYDELKTLKVPADKTFGKALLPVIVRSIYQAGAWSELEVVFDCENQISGASVAVQYAQSIFEGMKAYKVNQDIPQIFRPLDHAKRFNDSAKRMCIPALPEELFLQAVNLISKLYENHIPSQTGCALYLRPSAYATDYSLAITPSEKYCFSVHVAPTLPFANEMISVLIERQNKRSALGGTGNVKTAGNYAAGFGALRRAQQVGCATNLWLDPVYNKFIEEFSLMNFFIYYEGILHTPKLQSSFLPGVVRRSIISLTKDMGIKVSEQQIDIDKLIKIIQSGEQIEAFSTGTAAAVTPIKSFKEVDGTEYIISQEIGRISKLLKTQLNDIHEAKAEDRFNWMQNIY
ncbi:MAG: branched-chain-amino-acid transaminase [Rhizobiales bacterium]|nr:branched-chain-amino-acid transaminase [Hyphomicrobiales bacterium]NRB13216.1 branched-chain-amino-acid transaminase [Hyphomicrobiales bacterium]